MNSINFNQPVNNLPTGILNLILGYSFNCKVDNLPHSLIYLTFGCKFNQPINNLPPVLTELVLGSNKINYSMENLPSNIESIEFYQNNFECRLQYLPPKLKEIKFYYYSKFNEPLNNLPDTIEHIKLSKYYTQEINKFPINLKSLSCVENYPWINKLKELYQFQIYIYKLI